MGFAETFQDAKERRRAEAVEREANRAQEERVLAWERVAEIASELEKCRDGKAKKLAAELQQLATEHISYASWLGYGEEPASQETEPAVMATAQAELVGEVPVMVEPPAAPSKQELATFKHVCDGHDGKLCLYEDVEGHWVAVRASRFA